eukprot:363611-Chlamydomonas_euryale.AAC.15
MRSCSARMHSRCCTQCGLRSAAAAGPSLSAASMCGEPTSLYQPLMQQAACAAIDKSRDPGGSDSARDTSTTSSQTSASRRSCVGKEAWAVRVRGVEGPGRGKVAGARERGAMYMYSQPPRLPCNKLPRSPSCTAPNTRSAHHVHVGACAHTQVDETSVDAAAVKTSSSGTESENGA